MMKPTSLFLLLLALAALLRRAWEESTSASRKKQTAISAALFGAGFVAVVGSAVVYFALHWALADMFDVLVGANGYYAAHDRGVNSADDLQEVIRWHFEWFNPFASLVLGAYAVALIERRLRGENALLRRLVLPGAYLVAAFLSVLAQLKFYRYHWGAFVAPCAVFAATAHAICRERLAVRSPARAGLGLAAAVLVAYAMAGDPTKIVSEGWRNAFLWVSGAMTREEFASRYVNPPAHWSLRYWYHDSEMAGLWLREHSDPQDNVCARGFMPEVYAIAQRGYHGRFFWTNFLTDPKRFYRHEEWLLQDREDILRDPPRFLVTLADVHEGVDSLEWFGSLGLYYEQRFRSGLLTVSELAASSEIAHVGNASRSDRGAN
jgi:hypothetical protein